MTTRTIPTLSKALAPYLQRLLRPGFVVDLQGHAAEAHHAHVLASLLDAHGREALLEVRYENGWSDSVGGPTRRARADIWVPAHSSYGPQAYVEIKLALLHDMHTTQLGGRSYGLARAAPSWADDIYRLLVGPAGTAHCAFLLSLFGPSDGAIPSIPVGTSLRSRDVNADSAWLELSALASQASSWAAILALVKWCRENLGADVTQLGSYWQGDLRRWYAPVLIEWTQDGPASSAYVRKAGSA